MRCIGLMKLEKFIAKNELNRKGITKTRKSKVTLSAQQKLEYAKLMVREGYTNKQIEDMFGAGKLAVSRSKQQYLSELDGISLQMYKYST